MFSRSKLTLILTLGAMAISAPALAEPAGNRDGFGPNGNHAGAWTKDFDHHGDFGRNDHVGRGRGFEYGQRTRLLAEANQKIVYGDMLVNQGKQLIRYGLRSHQWYLVKQGRDLKAKGQSLIRLGNRLQREARMLAFN